MISNKVQHKIAEDALLSLFSATVYPRSKESGSPLSFVGEQIRHASVLG